MCISSRCTPSDATSMHTDRKAIGTPHLKEKSMSNSPSKRAAPMTYTRFSLDKSTPTLWRVTFDNPPINLIDAVMMKELLNLLTEIERDKQVGVVLFDSADPDFFLAHYDIAGDPAELEGVETTGGQAPLYGTPHSLEQVTRRDDQRDPWSRPRCGQRVRTRHRHPLRQPRAGHPRAVRDRRRRRPR